MIRASWLLAVLGCAVGLSACRKEASGPVPEPADSSEVAERAARGRSLFQHGRSARGAALEGWMGPERIELRGELAACSRCHTPSGRGSLEGGVEAPDIRPGALLHPRPRAVGEVEERSRPAYEHATLLRAITEGTSASGRRLGIAMPRYALGEAEGEELLAYLERLGEAPDPGVSPTTLTVGSALPLSGELGPVGREVEAVLRAAFEEINASGGIFRRRLELVVEDDAAAYGPGASSQRDGTTRLAERGVFALVASLRRWPMPSDELLRREEVPLVLPLAAGGSGERGPLFFLYPEEAVQARWVVQYLSRTEEEGVLRARALLVVRSEDEAGHAWAWAARQEALRRELPAPLEATALPQPLEGPPPAILYAGPASGLRTLLRELEARGLELPVFAPARLAEPSTAEGSRAQVRFVSPPGVEGHEAGLGEFSTFMSRHGLRPGHVAFQLQAYAAARVLAEALRRAGADLTRADLIQALESLRDFDTGVAPPVTFGVDRRVGVQGAQLVRVDSASGLLQAASPWLALSP
jgi:ABC-type branched-subunit amino acid transport system substrate-binding protein